MRTSSIVVAGMKTDDKRMIHNLVYIHAQPTLYLSIPTMVPVSKDFGTDMPIILVFFFNEK